MFRVGQYFLYSQNGANWGMQARKDFLAHLYYTKGYSKETSYRYPRIWASGGGGWTRPARTGSGTHIDAEQFAAWQIRERKVNPYIFSRRSSCLSLLQMALKNNFGESDSIYLADKPKRPQRIPVWLEKEEQAALQKAARSVDDLPREHLRAHPRAHQRRVPALRLFVRLHREFRLADLRGLKRVSVRDVAPRHSASARARGSIDHADLHARERGPDGGGGGEAIQCTLR